MSGQIRTFNITIGKVYNNGVECKNPKVELEKRKDIAVNCIDPSCGLYQIQISPKDLEPCLTFLVTCDDCDICGTKVIEKCLCDSIDDCEKCEICNVEGFCESTCTDICEDDGTCVECNVDHPCPCNQDCQNGKCTCPAGSTLNANGCCDECQNDGDCDTCSVCILVNGGKTCQAKDCNCDLNGKCGTPGECVECTQSGHCPENERCNSHCECECTPGYTRINGICTPTECPNGDEDCPPCFICSGLNCVPNQCPSGKVPVVIDGECACVQECNCEQPNCSSEFNFCGESAIEGKCGCIPCKGNCTDGCEDPCICDEDLDKCKFNPCFGSCENGSDCGPTCGCLNGECVPCEILDCATQECGTALGCACSNTNNCEKDDHCNDAPCSVASDCADGCTCDQGTCKSCSNYACPNDCSQHDGCACNGTKCDGDDTPCGDTLTIEKDEANCHIVGTLTKDNCCQCSPLTLDVIPPTSVTTSGSDKKVTFKAELRKGTFDGISVYSNPRLDNTTHPSIAENEKPLTGSVSMSYTVTSSLYTLTGTYLGDTTSAAVNTQSSFLGNAEATFASITLPSIGKETISGNQKSVVKSIKITFTQSNVYTFPNDCAYREGKVIGIYNINKNEDFSSLLPIGTTITSSDCRKPLFKWTKSSDSTFDETPFRKKYIDPKTVNVYEDIIDAEEGAESCFHYSLESDCTCDDPASKYVVFCVPNNFTANVTNCGKRAEVVIPTTCATNFNKDFILSVNGTDYKTFKLQSEFRETFDWGSPITSIKLRLACDTIGECDIEKTFPNNGINPIPQGICNSDGTVTFKFSEGSYQIGISSITFDGVTSLGIGSPKEFTFTGKTLSTDYTYNVVFTNGCRSDNQIARKDDCCNDPSITCLETGHFKIIATGGLDTYTYDGQPVPSDGIITPPTSGSKPLVYTCGDTTKTLLIYPYSQNSDCCRIVPNISIDGTTVTVSLSADSTSGTYTVVAGTKTGTVSPGGSLVLTGVEEGSITVSITNNSQSSCSYEEVIVLSLCDLGLTLSMDDESCRLIAETEELVCFCPSGSISGTITNVTSIPNNELAVSFSFNPTITGSSNVDVLSSSLKVYSNNILESTINLTNLNTYSGTINIPKDCNTNSTNIPYSVFVRDCLITESPCNGNGYLAVVTIESPYVLIDSTFGGTMFGTITQSGNDHYFYFLVGSGYVTFNLTFRNTITNDEYTSTITVNNLQFGGTETSSIEVENENCTNCSDIKFEYVVSMEDGCAYAGQLSKDICAGNSYILNSIALTKTDYTRKMEFVLYENNVEIRRDFAESPWQMIYEAIDSGFEPGKTYKSKAICGCEEEVSTSDCFQATITPIEPQGGYSCGKKFAFDIYSCYIGANATLSIGSTTTSFIVSPSGENTVTVDLPSPVVSDTVTATLRYSGNLCPQDIVFNNPTTFEYEVDYLCTDTVLPNLAYNATISATLNGAPATVTIVSIPSGVGYGTISGDTLNGVAVTTAFGVSIKLNNDPDCTYTVTLSKLCDCNILTASVTPVNQSICVINGAIQGTPQLSLTTTRTNNASAWYAISGSTTLVNGSISTSAVSYNIPLALVPSSGVNNLSVKFRDSLGGNDCEIDNVTVTRNNLDYTTQANACSSGYWSVTITGSGLTISGQTSGTISGNNIINIPISVASVTFNVSGNGCTSSGVVVNRPAGCVSCNNSNVSGSYTVLTQPCSTTATDGEIRISASSSNSGCTTIASVTFNGASAAIGSGGYWYATIPYSYSGNYTIIITDECGCYRDVTANIVQNCCSPSVPSINASVPSICGNTLPQSVTYTVSGLPSGHNLELIGIESSPGGTSVSGTWTTSFTNTGGTFQVTSTSGSPTTFYIKVRMWNGAVGSGECCTCPYYISTAYVNITTCATDPCSGLVCPDCQHCINNMGSAECVSDCNPFESCCSDVCKNLLTDSSNCGACGVTCDPGEVCCSGVCQVPCSPGPDIPYPNGCDYIHESCSPCSSVVTSYLNCLTAPSVINMNSWTCELGDCVVRGSITITKNAACSFIAPADNYVYPYGGSVNCSSVVGQIDVLTVESTSVVGNNLTINFIASKNSAAPVDICGNSYPVAVFISVNGGSYNCCNLTTVSFSACPVCTTC